MHCYYGNSQNSIPLGCQDLSIDDFVSVIDEACKVWDNSLEVILAGGDPLLWPSLYLALNALYQRKIKFGILGNPDMIVNTPDLGLLFSSQNIGYFQLSLEGFEKETDLIRGTGTFNLTLEAIGILRRSEVPVYVMATVHKRNAIVLPKLIPVLNEIDVQCFDCSPYVPLGQLTKSEMLSPEEYKNFLFEMIRESSNKRISLGMKDPLSYVLMNELGFLTDSTINLLEQKCRIGSTILAIEVDGTIYPCRRLPISAGNINKTTLLEALKTSQSLLCDAYKNTACSACKYDLCNIGLPCVSYGLYGTLKHKYPMCWRKC